MTKIKNYYSFILSYCILFCACTHEPDFKITKEFADSLKQYDYVGTFSEGLAKVKVGGKWGVVDKYGTCSCLLTITINTPNTVDPKMFIVSCFGID